MPASYSYAIHGHHNRKRAYHHTSEHSEFLTIIAAGITPRTRSDNPLPKTRTRFLLPHSHGKTINRHAHPDAPKPIHPDKEQLAPTQQFSWEQTSNSLFKCRPSQEPHQKKNRNSIFPITFIYRCRRHVMPGAAGYPRLASFTSPTNKWWRWTESNRRPPACKAGALPIELHPRSVVSGQLSVVRILY